MLEARTIEYSRCPQIAADVEIPQVHRILRISRLTGFWRRVPKKQITSPGFGTRNSVRIEFGWWKPVLIVIGVQEQCQAHLSEGVEAARLLAPLLRAIQRSKEHTRQNR